jgi:hypothetical protein
MSILPLLTKSAWNEAAAARVSEVALCFFLFCVSPAR